MKTNFRLIQPADQKEVAQLMHRLYIEDPSDKPMTDEKIQRTLETLGNEPGRGNIMVIESENIIVGYAILINFWSNEFGGNLLNIDELYIKEEFRSRGIGSAFIRHLANSKFGNSVAIQLEVTPDNHRARRLYESLGFSQHKNMQLDLLI
ncbi:GNAT family N-acetyltransferase [Roseivirga sp.]|uniref:GNAT family N-acetyltransferase n=1 Tax=Roseivirga sp. TaxID=1964215 RepID=UPI003B52D3A8